MNISEVQIIIVIGLIAVIGYFVWKKKLPSVAGILIVVSAIAGFFVFRKIENFKPKGPTLKDSKKAIEQEHKKLDASLKVVNKKIDEEIEKVEFDLQINEDDTHRIVNKLKEKKEKNSKATTYKELDDDLTDAFNLN